MQQPYLPVNWIDGMKINKSHFIAQNNASTYQAAQGISGMLNVYNYGLLPNRSHSGEDLKIHVVIDNHQQLQVRLLRCRAITYGGHLIQFNEENFSNNNCIHTILPELDSSSSAVQKNATGYFIVLFIDPYQRQPFGLANPDELPPRLPFSTPTLALQLMPVNEAGKHILGDFHLPIGKILMKDHTILLDENYIPPCCTVSSHPGLLETHAESEVFFSKMECCALQIIRKIQQKKQMNEIAIILQKLCEQITLYTSSALTNLSLVALDQPPVYLLNGITSFARLMKNTLDAYNSAGREELINYCTDWCEIDNATLDTVMISMVNCKYDHLNIQDSLELVKKFMHLNAQMFTQLAQLDYIGKRRDMGIFVKEQVIYTERQELPQKRTSFLAE